MESPEKKEVRRKKIKKFLFINSPIFIFLLVPSFWTISNMSFPKNALKKDHLISIEQKDLRGGQFASLEIFRYENIISIKYPSYMKENKPQNISVTIDRSIIPVQLGKNPTIFSDKSYVGEMVQGEFIELGASDFKVSPESQREVEKDSDTPYTFIWNINPESDGDKELFLNLSGLSYKKSDKSLVFTEKFTINSKEKKFPKDKVVRFSIYVYNKWGISSHVADLIKWGIGFIAFILMLPILHEILKINFLQKRNNNPS